MGDEILVVDLTKNQLNLIPASAPRGVTNFQQTHNHWTSQLQTDTISLVHQTQPPWHLESRAVPHQETHITEVESLVISMRQDIQMVKRGVQDMIKEI